MCILNIVHSAIHPASPCRIFQLNNPVFLSMFQGHSWEVTASLYMSSLYDGVTLSGDTVTAIDPENATANFSLSVDQPGQYFFTFHVVSTPAQYDLTVISDAITIYPAGYVIPYPDVSRTVQMIFNADYTTVVGDDDEYFEVALYNQLAPAYPNVSISGKQATEGRHKHEI